jgi:hypothetical protein
MRRTMVVSTARSAAENSRSSPKTCTQLEAKRVPLVGSEITDQAAARKHCSVGVASGEGAIGSQQDQQELVPQRPLPLKADELAGQAKPFVVGQAREDPVDVVHR